MTKRWMDYTIAGFDGVADAECEIVLPMIQRKGEEVIARFSPRDPLDFPRAWHGSEETAELVREKLITILPLPTTLQDSNSATHATQPAAFPGVLLAYIKDSLFSLMHLDAKRFLIKATTGFNNCTIWKLADGQTWVLSGESRSLVSLFEQVAELLRIHFIQTMSTLTDQSGPDSLLAVSQRAERLVSVGLLAAQSDKTRQLFFIYQGAVRRIKGDFIAVDNLYDLFVSVAYPDWQKAAFLELVAEASRPTRVTPLPALDREDQNTFPQLMQQLMRQHGERLSSFRIARHQYQHSAKEWRTSWSKDAIQLKNLWRKASAQYISHTLRDAIIEKLKKKTAALKSAHIWLSDRQMLCLAGEELIWKTPAIVQKVSTDTDGAYRVLVNGAALFSQLTRKTSASKESD